MADAFTFELAGDYTANTMTAELHMFEPDPDTALLIIPGLETLRVSVSDIFKLATHVMREVTNGRNGGS